MYSKKEIAILVLFGSFLLLSLWPYADDLNNCRLDYNDVDCIVKYISYGFEQIQGKCYVTSNESYYPNITELKNISVFIYLANTNLTETDVQDTFQDINSIWNSYGVNFVIDRIDVSLAKEAVDIDGGSDNTDMISKRINTFYDLAGVEKNITLVFFSGTRKNGGIQLPAVTKTNKAVVFPNTTGLNLSWTATHELGHILGLYDKSAYSGDINLMTHNSKYIGCIQSKFYPKNLNRKQVETVLTRL